MNYKLPEEYNGITIHTTKAKHHEIIDEQYAIGFILEFDEETRFGDTGEKIKVGFTGDTGWDWDRGEIMVKPFIALKPQLVVAHLGSIKLKEFDYVYCKSQAKKNKCFYPYHLGLLGMTRFLDETKPALTIVSEFGEELRKSRKQIVESIGNVLKLNCLPGDIGLHIRLYDLSVLCSITGDFVDYRYIEVKKDPQIETSLYFCDKNSDTTEFFGRSRITKPTPPKRLYQLKDVLI